MTVLLFDTGESGKLLRDRLGRLGVSCVLVHEDSDLRVVEPWNLDAVVLQLALSAPSSSPGRVDAHAPEREHVARLRGSGYAGPLVVLTSNATEGAPRILAAGADDCLDRQVEPIELVARLEAIARRVGHLRFGPLRIDPAKRIAWINGKDLGLQHTEMDLLLHLAWARGTPVDARKLGLLVWGSPETARNQVEVAIWRLRSKLGGCEWLVETVRGRGYRLRKEPRLLGGPSPHRHDPRALRNAKKAPKREGRPRISVL